MFQSLLLPFAYGFSYQFQLPSDFVRVVSVSAEDYRIENDQFLCDDSSIELKYVANIDETKLDSLLAESISCFLAEELAYPLTQSQSLKDSIKMDFKLALVRAKTADAQDEPAGVIEADLYLDSRLGGVANPTEPRRKW